MKTICLHCKSSVNYSVNQTLKWNTLILVRSSNDKHFLFTARADLRFVAYLCRREVNNLCFEIASVTLPDLKSKPIDFGSGLPLRQLFETEPSFTRLMRSRDNERGERAKVKKIEKIKMFVVSAMKYL